jgi:Na+/melibiose symporter-like transporter
MMYAIFPDIPDVHELNTGERREAIYSSLITLFRKFSSALAIFAVSNAIGPRGGRRRQAVRAVRAVHVRAA